MLLGKWCLSSCKDTASVYKIHALIITSGLFTYGNPAAQLIASYARVRRIDIAYKLFDKLPIRGIDSWNAMLIAYSRRNDPLEVINLYKKMIPEKIKPDSSTFTVSIKACTCLLNLELGEEIWEDAVECGYGDDIFVSSAVLNLYAKCGKMDKAMRIFDRLSKRDVVSWSTMISGFVRCGRPEEALDVYRTMLKTGLDPDKVTMLALIQASANIPDSQMAKSLHGFLIRKGFPMDIVVQTSLIDMYAKNGKLGIASALFRIMVYRNSVSWGTLISGYAQNGYAGESLVLLVEMQSCGFELDFVSLVSALLACSQLGSPLLGKEVHGYIVRRFETNQILTTALIDMYAKCGLLSYSRVLYNMVRFSGDIILWNTIIASYGIHGQGEEALKIFHQMLREACILPDHVTFASLLSALSHSGLVKEGKHWFDVMINEYRMQPMEKHYVSVVDLLARNGRVKEASDVIKSMSFEPGIAVWVALLSGCLNHKKFPEGELAAQKVLELKPDNAGIYALVSNFFAAAKKWDEVAMVRKLMKTNSIKKVPGHSVVEVNGKLHSFLADDMNHPQYQKILEVLKEMENEMRALGYVPKMEFVLHNVEDDVKVRMLRCHSERLAIGFGILNTKPGARLLIIKNLRVCGDCHEAIKFISIVAKREIIVRDMKRFHHFRNGCCSCGDYW